MTKLLLSLGVAAIAFSQSPTVVSPDVQAGGRVTFRLLAPNAHKVTVSLEGRAEPFPLEKDQQGIWSVTTTPLDPDIYGYSFDVDGAHIVDPSNTEIKPNLRSLSNVVHVPGTTPQSWDVTDIPHGMVHHHFYKSNIVGDNRDYFVYTPPGYDPAGAVRYPVLYLLHGYSDDASGWTAVGKANLILDKLIAEKRARPMLVVMPLGYGAPEIVHPAPGVAPFGDILRQRNYDRFRSALVDEVIPAVERDYKADSSRDARAIAGLSMGGAESLLTGLNRTDKFSWVGAFSSGGLGEDFTKAFPQLDASVNAKLHLLWIACGTEDRLITPNRKLIEWMKTNGIQLTAVETPGMHTWLVWRRNLTVFAPLLFGNQVRPAIITGQN